MIGNLLTSRKNVPVEVVSRQEDNMLVPQYKIIEDPVKHDFIIQRYINSVLGWTFVTTRSSRKDAENWILEGIIKK